MTGRTLSFNISLVFLLTLTLSNGCGGIRQSRIKTNHLIAHFDDTKKTIESMVIYAKSFLGTRYQYGGTGKKGQGFDCSGFTQHVFKKFGISLARQATDQFEQGDEVARVDMKRGDLIFFTTYKSGPSHVGIYLGGGKFIHSPSSGEKVRIDETFNVYWKGRWVGARRVIE